MYSSVMFYQTFLIEKSLHHKAVLGSTLMNNVMTSQQPKLVHSSVQTFLCWHTSSYNNNGHGIHHLLYLEWSPVMPNSMGAFQPLTSRVPLPMGIVMDYSNSMYIRYTQLIVNYVIIMGFQLEEEPYVLTLNKCVPLANLKVVADYDAYKKYSRT